VNDRSFDSVARDAAGVSRRESIFALGAAGLMAAFAGPFTADAKKKHAAQRARRCQTCVYPRWGHAPPF
jgi:hypothetical protein